MLSSRNVLVLHYHFFKNAGTSIDAMLQRNFGTHWVQQEFPTAGKEPNVSRVEAFLARRPEICALSSHTANLPLPMLEGRTVFPIVFLRHPVDRCRSAYEFERRQVANTFGANLAKAQDFAGYIRELLAHPVNRQARNFQAYRLAFGVADGDMDELSRAKKAMETMPFVGLVEQFGQSIEHLQKMIAPLIPGFQAVIVSKNRSVRKGQSLETRLAEIANELGPDLSRDLWAANCDDLALYDAAALRHF